MPTQPPSPEGCRPGHIGLGALPRTKKWRQVVDLLQRGGDVEAIAAAAAVAAERDPKRATTDPAFVQTLWLLTRLPIVARGPAFAADLQTLGLSVADRPGLMEVVAAFTDAVDRHSRGQEGRTDLGEMAQMAAVESIVALVGQSLPSLFSPTPEEVQREIGRYASGDRFSLLAREFFARLTRRRLDYYLSRELANHIGSGARSDDDVERSAFDAALDRHCREASRIVEAFAGGCTASTSKGRTARGDPRITGLRDPDAYIAVPAGRYPIGDERKTVAIEAPYYIGRYPVTISQFRDFKEDDGYNARQCWSDAGWAWRQVTAVSEPYHWHDRHWNGDNQPLVGVSFREAEACAAWAGGRLPTEKGWEAAANRLLKKAPPRRPVPLAGEVVGW